MYIGAGGEPANKDTTIFDDSIKEVAQFINKNPDIKADLALNGGHKKTEEILQNSFRNVESKSTFLASDYDRLIKSYKSKLENNEMVSGDQLMIYIDTHGAEKTWGSKSHLIATSEGSVKDLNSLSGTSTVNLDRLEELKTLAKAKGVRMAIIDSSCHSGNSQALADDNTCVISSTGPKHYGYMTFSKIIAGKLEKGKNLEEIFLASRSKDQTGALPMISTAAGKEVTDLLYEKITPFLYYFDDEHDKLFPYLKAHQGAEAQCIANFDSLIETMNQVEELNTVTKKILWWKTKKKTINLSKLKKLLGKYQSSMLEVQAKMKELNSDRLNHKESFKTPTQSVNYTWKELLVTDFKANISDLEKRLSVETQPTNLILLKDLISVYNQANLKKEELIKTQPDLLNIPTLELKIKNSIDSNFFTTAAIGAEERKLYSALYSKAQEQKTSSTPNPCRDFKL
jgi:hypothetical protein